MNFWHRTYSIAFNPNLQKDDFLLVFKLLFNRKEWLNNQALINLASQMKTDYSAQKALLFNSGRSALYLALKSLKLPKNSEVLLQSFTCVANVGPVVWNDLKPVFVDTNKDNTNMNVGDLENKITALSRVILIQHTFGFPDEVDKIVKLCQKHKLVLIEDCAHTFSSTYLDKKVGTWGDFAFFSFGRDKALSGVSGGALLINRQKYVKPVTELYSSGSCLTDRKILKLLIYPLAIKIIESTYGWMAVGKLTLGKLLMLIYQRSGLLDYPVLPSEKKLVKPDGLFKKMSNVQAFLAYNQYQKKDSLAARRRDFYRLWLANLRKILLTDSLPDNPEAVPLRLPIFVPQPKVLISESRKLGLLLGDWYRPAIAPKGVKLEENLYNKNMCANAEFLSSRVVNLPLCPKFSDYRQEQAIELFLKAYLQYQTIIKKQCIK